MSRGPDGRGLRDLTRDEGDPDRPRAGKFVPAKQARVKIS
jgi:hypothetical protein